MENSLEKDYISQIQQHEKLEGDLNQRDTTIAAIAGDVTLNRLRDILLILNGGLLIIVPGVAWIMTRHTLAAYNLFIISKGSLYPTWPKN